MDIDIKCCSEDLDKFNKKDEKPVIGKCNSVRDLTEKYEIKDNRLILRLLTIKGTIRGYINKDIDYDTLLNILNSELTDSNLDLTTSLNNYLPTKTNNDILEIYKQKTIGTR